MAPARRDRLGVDPRARAADARPHQPAAWGGEVRRVGQTAPRRPQSRPPRWAVTWPALVPAASQVKKAHSNDNGRDQDRAQEDRSIDHRPTAFGIQAIGTDPLPLDRELQASG
jgi:hypothetical protein